MLLLVNKILIEILLGIHAAEDGPPKNNHQPKEQLNKEKKERTQYLTRFGNLLTSSRQGDRVLIELINYRLQLWEYKYWEYYPPLYSQKNHEEKKTKNT